MSTVTVASTKPASRGQGFRDSLSAAEIEEWLHLPAAQQPKWAEPEVAAQARSDLACQPGLVGWDEVQLLRLALADVVGGKLRVVQAGDCAEELAECAPEALTRKVGLLDALAGAMRVSSGYPVLRVGRIAGQFAKPRSNDTEIVAGRELPTFRGHLVNGPEPDEEARRHDALRLSAGYRAARAAAEFLRPRRTVEDVAAPVVWTSHEMLVLDYELPMLRRDADGRLLLTSTHWPWIGDRTRHIDGAHVRLLAAVTNPVACKVGPSISREELLRLCEVLDPDRVPGRLTLVARLGVGRTGEMLPGLVSAVREAGHPVIWLNDPMHGNTVAAPDGRKTRLLPTIAAEVGQFQQAVRAGGGNAAGLHLETTPDAVTECAADRSELARIGHRYTSLCDPRLNPAQAIAIAQLWTS